MELFQLIEFQHNLVETINLNYVSLNEQLAEHMLNVSFNMYI